MIDVQEWLGFRYTEKCEFDAAQYHFKVLSYNKAMSMMHHVSLIMFVCLFVATLLPHWLSVLLYLYAFYVETTRHSGTDS
jgi:predicted membrane protein